MKLNDELLLKYADGSLASVIEARVEQALQQDRSASERLRLMQLSGAALKAEAMANQQRTSPVVAELARAIHAGELDANDLDADDLAPRSTSAPHKLAPASKQQTAPSVKSPGWQIAASMALLAFGLGTGYFARDLGFNDRADQQANPVWLVRVVDYHTLYVRETVTAGPAKMPNKAELKSRFAAILGQSVTIPDLGAEQLEFRRGQYLKFKDSPIIQLAYLPKDTGKPVALCFKTAKGPDKKPTYSQISGLGVMRWHQSGLDYVLVGDLPEQRLRAAANNALAQIDQGKSTSAIKS